MAIFTSFPGLGELPAARLLAEIGDDATRFADARRPQAYAGAATATRAQRHLFNRFLGCLYYCLQTGQTGQTYAEDLAFPTALPIAA